MIQNSVEILLQLCLHATVSDFVLLKVQPVTTIKLKHQISKVKKY